MMNTLNYKQIDDHLQAYIPNFDYLLTDLAILDDDRIYNLFHSLYLRMGLQIMKHIYEDKEILEARLEEILEPLQKILAHPKGETFYRSTLVYLYKSTNLEKETIRKISLKFSLKGGDIAMTTAEKLKQEGKQEGLQEGKQEGLQEGIKNTAIKMIQKGFNDNVISECTGLSLKEIEKLKNSNKYKN